MGVCVVIPGISIANCSLKLHRALREKIITEASGVKEVWGESLQVKRSAVTLQRT